MRWRDETNGFIEVSSSGLSSEEKDFLQKSLKPDLENLLRAIDDFSGAIAKDQLFALFDRRILANMLK